MNERLSEVCKEFIGSAFELISELVNAPVDVNEVELNDISLQDEILTMPEDTVVIPIKYEGSLDESHTFIMSQKLASIIGTMVMGKSLSDVVEKIDDEIIANISDVFSQVGVVIANSLSMAINGSIQSVSEGAGVGPLSVASAITSESAVKCQISLNISGIDETLSYFMPETIKSLLQAGQERAQPEPVPSSDMAAGSQIGVEDTDVAGIDEQEPETPVIERREAATSSEIPFETIEPSSQQIFQQTDSPNLKILMDVPLEVTVELGRTNMSIKDVLDIGEGSIIELNKLAGEPVDFYVNGKLISRGEVVVIDENFGVRITEIISPAERISSL